MISVLDVTLKATGTRKQLADALKMLADNLWSEDRIAEIYNIDGASYNDNTIFELIVQDPDDESGIDYQTTDKSEGQVN